MSSRPTRGSRKRQLPLDYMLDTDPERRDRLAICAAQYCHPRAADHPKGKKVVAREAAAEAGEYGWGNDLKGDWPQ